MHQCPDIEQYGILQVETAVSTIKSEIYFRNTSHITIMERNVCLGIFNDNRRAISKADIDDPVPAQYYRRSVIHSYSESDYISVSYPDVFDNIF
jgi:hypothetical protein